MADKRMTEDEIIGELESGMTIGIGGWGSRRKPMSLVRALLRSDLTDLHIVSYGGDGDGHFYQVLCSDNAKASVRVESKASRACYRKLEGDEVCGEGWTVREAAVRACR